MDDHKDIGAKMAINPLVIETVGDARKQLGMIDGFEELEKFCLTKAHLRFPPLIRYIITLYSQDSFLNAKPIRPLAERQDSAAHYAGFEKQRDEKYHTQVRFALMQLNTEEIFNFVFNYIVYQKNYIWSEICTLEQQLAENQRIRMRPIAEDTDNKVIGAMEKKANLTRHFKDWYKALQEHKNEFYGDHEEVKAAFDLHKSGLVTIELAAQER